VVEEVEGARRAVKAIKDKDNDLQSPIICLKVDRHLFISVFLK
jgi:hypothetical protein